MACHQHRSAWVVMGSSASMHEMISVLRDLTVVVPGIPDPVSGVISPGINFKPQATVHSPRQTLEVPACMSHASRVAFDTVRALELAELLDEDKNVPSEQRLSSLLDSPCGTALGPTDKLDIAIAYLRRVHFVVYYGGRRFRDEAQLLTAAPAIVRRSFAFVSSVPTATSGTSATPAATVSALPSVAVASTLTTQIVSSSEVVESSPVEKIDSEPAQLQVHGHEQPQESDDTSSTVVAVVAADADVSDELSSLKRKRDEDAAEALEEGNDAKLSKLDETEGTGPVEDTTLIEDVPVVAAAAASLSPGVENAIEEGEEAEEEEVPLAKRVRVVDLGRSHVYMAREEWRKDVYVNNMDR